MLPSSRDLVPSQTAEDVNEEIRQATERSIALYASAGREALDRRLEELDWEWDIERAIEAHAASVSLLGLALGTAVSRKFYLIPAVVSGFLLFHALQGWCPPVPLLRRMGFRTPAEIAYERYALKAIRGDFEGLDMPDQMTMGDAAKVLDAVKA